MEYAITIGEGLLLEYGYLEDDDLMADVILGIPEGSTIIVSDAPSDCQTGK